MKIDKIKILLILCIGLFLLNLATLSFLFVKNKGGHQMPGMRKHTQKPELIISKRLDFDEEQRREYKRLIKAHQNGIRGLEQERRKVKNELFGSLNENDSLLQEQMLSKLADIQKRIESKHMEHFKAVKALCKGEQLEKFEKLSNRLARIFHPHPPRKHP